MESRDNLKGLLYGKLVQVKAVDTDRYGRLVVRIYLNRTDAGLDQLQKGYAWHYTQYDSTPSYEQAEEDARASRLGLWAGPSPIPPWE